MINKYEEHHWSGWPGACCLKCGSSDPLEVAFADNTFDPVANTWVSKAIEEKTKLALVCPVRGILEWDTKLNKWELIKE